MIPRQRKLAAWRQAAGLLAAALGAVAVVVVMDARPADEDELKIPIGELSSQSFELKLLNEQVAGGASRLFSKAHAGQLARSIARSRHELESLKTLPRLNEAQAVAMRQSDLLVQAVVHLDGAGGPLDSASAAQLGRVGTALNALKQTLER